MRLFYLVRHGNIENSSHIYPGRLPLRLSRKGIGEARRLMIYFRDKSISRIYSSPVFRCKQTAKIIANNKIPVYFDLRLAELLYPYQGMQFKGKSKSRDVYGHKKELGGEDFGDLIERTRSFFEEIFRKERRDMIICSHSDPLLALRLNILKRRPTEKQRQWGGWRDPEKLEKGAIMPFKVEGKRYTQLKRITQEMLAEKSR